MNFVQDDGGRNAAGFKGETGDCVTRAIAIATGEPYMDVYCGLNAVRVGLRQTRGVRGSSARTGVTRRIYEKYLRDRGWRWVPTMHIGTGCQTHLRAEELPAGRIICRVSKHMVAVIDGVIHDTYDPSRNGTRCVYGYFAQGVTL